MTRTIIVTPAAEADIAEATNWYDAFGLPLSASFRQALDLILQHIADYPDAHTRVTRGLRRALVHGFPHGVFYRQTENAIEVIAVLHTSRHPRLWRARDH